ncbi:MAG: LysM peptidoglycan-binding domain-containing protein, partial [Spirochaetes bacterium]|nr:LysM peptidoglycan-binding domain-containing protein [Spirochaetota bacterium]
PNLVDSTTGVGVDLGLTYDFSRFIRISMVVANLLEPNISFFNDGTEYVNQQLRAGLAWQLGDVSFLQNALISVGLAQISRDSDDNRRPETIYKAGFEFWQVKRSLGFRFGYKTVFNVFSSGLTFKQPINPANILAVNYAFNYPLDSKNYKHYFSLNWEVEFPDHFYDYRSVDDIEENNKIIQDNFRKGMVILKYKTKPNDNLYNISLIHYGTPQHTKLLMDHNNLKEDETLPTEVEVPYNAKDFELYKVQPIDTIETIAEKYYGDRQLIGKIKKYNIIEFSKLRPGRILIINVTEKDRQMKKKYESDALLRLKNKEAEKLKEEKKEEKKKEEKKEEEKKEEKKEEVKPEKTEVPDDLEGDEKVHTVGAGDTLRKISIKYYNDPELWKKMVKYNGMKPPYSLKLGQKLNIPPKSVLIK